MNLKDKARWLLGSLSLGSAILIGSLGVVNLANGDSDWRSGEEQEEHERRGNSSRESARNQLNAIDPVYREECSACHLAYPAQLLPKRSWEKLMAGLDDHFGENAELMPEAQIAISRYLAENAGDVNPGRRSERFIKGISSSDPLVRITETRYFKRKHDEVPKRLVQGNPEVGSFSQCQACHGPQAEKGIFDEDTVDIPGYGRWD